VRAGLLCLTMLLVMGFKIQAQILTEHESKAVLLLNIARYVEWPLDAVRDQESPLVVGILGQTTFHSAARQTLEGKEIRTHKVVVVSYDRVEHIKGCHVLYIASSERPRLRFILESLHGQPILTISEMDGFAEMGGVVGLIAANNRIRFKINHKAARAANLVVSARLLKAAEAIIEPRSLE
jgi:hypothetical protein